MKNAYVVQDPDFNRSPFTGMTRKHYIDLAKHLLERAFNHVASFESPFAFPIVPGKSYPQTDSPPWRFRAHEFESLERSLTLAAPLMHVEPEVSIKGWKLRDWYCNQLYKALTPGNPQSLPLPEELPDATYQFTCEFGGLLKTLLLLPDVIWPYFTQKQKDEMAITISKWAHHRTTQNNWRIFNMVALSFLKKQGYCIDDELLKSHLLWVVSYHSGEGWYLEQTYNYYTISLFIVYGTVWARTFGDEQYPEIAATIERSAYEMMKTYPYFFARDGYINMWARSICYRTWISGGFPVSFMLKDGSPLDPGWARRLCSGSLLQFVAREDFYHNDIPALGFYSHKEYMIQDYSCPGSPFLMFLPFIALALPEDSPFWTEKENEGMWEGLGDRSERHALDKPGLVLVNHGSTGTSEILPGKVYYDDPNYSKLTYNTHFPWEDQDHAGGTAMEYTFRSLDPRDVRGEDINFYLTGKKIANDAKKNADFTILQSMVYNGIRGGVLYRQALMRKPPNNGVGYIVDLAEITLPGGVLRVDRSRIAFEHELNLGHFGLPHYNGVAAKVERREDAQEDVQGSLRRKVITASIPGRRVALIAYSGWDSLEAQVHSNRNAETDESTVVYARRKRTQQNPPMELMVLVMLHRMDDGVWTDEELDPLAVLEIKDIMGSGSALGADLRLRDGRTFIVDFGGIDGYRSC
ncbi:MAG: DUF2264 domain-containing protein [Spirochaetes bacterium]|nr:DUF2264 domain-containing protein [Spirochaetota bacterium]